MDEEIKSPVKVPLLRGRKTMQPTDDVKRVFGRETELELKHQIESDKLRKECDEVRRRLRVWTTELVPADICKRIIEESDKIGYSSSNHDGYGTAILSLRTNEHGISDKKCIEFRKNAFLWEALCTIHCQAIEIIRNVYGDDMTCAPLKWKELSTENLLNNAKRAQNSSKRTERGSAMDAAVGFLCSPIKRHRASAGAGAGEAGDPWSAQQPSSASPSMSTRASSTASLKCKRKNSQSKSMFQRAEEEVDLLKQKAVKMAANDIFLARYSSDTCAGLDLHRDGTWVSYVLHLGGDGVDGGTKFQNILQTPKITHKVGEISVHNGQALHGAESVQNGKRYVFVGFVKLADGLDLPNRSDFYENDLSGDIDASGEQLNNAAVDAWCCVCGSEADPARLLLCDGCNATGATHIYCTKPRLREVPPDEEKWFCSSCTSKKGSCGGSGSGGSSGGGSAKKRSRSRSRSKGGDRDGDGGV